MQSQSRVYSYPQYFGETPQKHYPTASSTSSAFSASANPNEDWTKISDLAERRRIQNRIAQRNYRKKLKKRLEDLERRAGSSSSSSSNSPSPEQRHEQLSSSATSPASQTSPAASPRERSNSDQSQRELTPDVLPQQYVLPADDRGMFSQQFTRQLSTSPPPFSSYPTMPTMDDVSYSDYSLAASYCTLPDNTAEMPMYQQYPSGFPSAYAVPNMFSTPLKEDFYSDDEMNPFSMSYASISGMPSYSEIPFYTPALSDASEPWHAPSPNGPATPEALQSIPAPAGYHHS